MRDDQDIRTSDLFQDSPSPKRRGRPGRPTLGDRPMTPAEKQRLYRERLKERQSSSVAEIFNQVLKQYRRALAELAAERDKLKAALDSACSQLYELRGRVAYLDDQLKKSRDDKPEVSNAKRSRSKTTKEAR